MDNKVIKKNIGKTFIVNESKIHLGIKKGYKVVLKEINDEKYGEEKCVVTCNETNWICDKKILSRIN